jgi:SpoVK/Ycf46/Vps4 family AAA+-type ATPase
MEATPFLRQRKSATKSAARIPPITHLWLLRMLVPLGGHNEFVNRHGFRNDSLAAVLGLGEWIDPTDRDFDPRAVRSALRKLHEVAEQKYCKAKIPACLSRNVARLSELVGLSETDRRVLQFAVMLHAEQLLDDTADYLGQLTSIKVYRALAGVLDLPEQEVRASLSMQGILAESGLVSVDRNGTNSLRSKLDLLSNSFADTLSSSETDPVNLLLGTVNPSAPALLGIADYSHISATLSVLRPYLKQSASDKRRGVNIFLHGQPGTGKSQLVKVLAKELECELFEVASEDGDGDAVDGQQRLRAFRAAQSFFAQRRALILFDEVEDVFNDGDRFFGRKSTAQTRKGWINRMLEDNAVPTLWLSNDIQGLDPAFIRRFDMVIELPVPPRSLRERIIRQSCTNLLDAPAVARIADSDSLAPAVVTRAASVVGSIRKVLGEPETARAMELLISNTLEAQGHKPIRKNDPNRLPEIYDPAFIHADSDLAEVAAGLVQTKAGRLCLYGPPGTGKTAFGRWLAEQLEVPLMVKRASDLMSMWVGGSEKNIAQAFRQAEQEGAMLLIDEVDSFLQDRRSANRSWEVTLVNEMLTQIESFPGVFLASTNLMDDLDQAALRRFDLKVKFDFLKPAQALELLNRYCIQLGFAPPQPDELARLSRLRTLTPGDFAAVIRQNRFRPIATAAALVGALEAECAVKEMATPAIGFVQ